MILPYLIEKEFRQIRRDPVLIKIILLLPIIQLLVLPLAANFELRNISVAIVDPDQSDTSRKLTEQVLGSGYFKGIVQESSYPQAMPFVEDNKADVILNYPPRMERDMQNEGYAHVLIAANAVNGTKGGLAASYLSNIIGQVDTSRLPIRFINNPYLDYRVYMVPGIIAFLVTLIGGFVSALNIVSEKEKGTMEQINVSPIPKHVFILSKLIPFWIIGFVVLTLALLVAYIAYGIVPVGSYAVIYLYTTIYLLFATGMGLAISSISSSQQQAMFTAFFFVINFGLLSGLFTPISSMPEWVQKITLLNPMRYFVEVQRMVFIKGSQLPDLSMHFLVTGCYAIVINTVAILGYRKHV